MTASKLLESLRWAGATAEDSPAGLVVEGDISPDLDAMLGVLSTGIRAILAHRRWIGYPAATGKPVLLDPKKLLPRGIDRLTVEGDAAWDCLRTRHLNELPQLWQAAPMAKAKAA